MLERIALHQTRLRTPGLGLDAKGVALGAKGLVLLPSIDRLVAFLAVYTRERSLEDLLQSLVIRAVKSKLGTRELVLEVSAESSDRMDRLAETARLVGGFSFTGTSRHFVQYRDAAAPFGYDAGQLLPSDAALVLYHDTFTQSYEADAPIDLRALLLRLEPHVDPTTALEDGPRWFVTEQGLGPALIHYFVRSRVQADVTIAEWPPESAFDEGPVRRYLFQVTDLPPRMKRLLHSTPGIVGFLPTAPGVAVEAGFRHPVTLRACPVFDGGGMVFLRGHRKEPLIVKQLPQLGDVRAFARVELHGLDVGQKPAAQQTRAPEPVRVPLRIVPTTRAFRNVTASFLLPHEVPLFRKLAYALPPSTIAKTRIAITAKGAFLRNSQGIEAIPLGEFFVEVHPQLHLPAGFDFIPAVAPEVLHRALGTPPGVAVFVMRDGKALSVEEHGFVPLETLLLEATPWEPLAAEPIERALGETPIELTTNELGFFPLSGVAPPKETAL